MEKSRAISGGHWGGARRRALPKNSLSPACTLNHRVLASAARITCQWQVSMASTTWFRTGIADGVYDAGWTLLAQIPNGSTYLRMRWSWGFAGVTADTVDIASVMANTLVVGLVTTIGDGTETPPNPATASGDAAPPTQRWLWWEIRQPVATAIDHAAGVIAWRDSGQNEITDVRSQVLAVGVSPSQRLNLWFRWQSTPFIAWDSSGEAFVWVGSSVLYKTP